MRAEQHFGWALLSWTDKEPAVLPVHASHFFQPLVLACPWDQEEEILLALGAPVALQLTVIPKL